MSFNCFWTIKLSFEFQALLEGLHCHYLRLYFCKEVSELVFKFLWTWILCSTKVSWLIFRYRPTVPAGSHSTTFGGVSIASHHSSAKVVGKCKAIELASSGESSEPAKRHPALDPHHCRQPLQEPRVNKLPPVAGNSGPPRAGRHTRL